MPKTQNKLNNRAGAKPLLALIVATVILILFLVVALLLSPKPGIPEFNITDQDGDWKAQGTIAVFDDLIKPGSEGEYKFIIRSESEWNLNYGFRLSEYLGNINCDAKPFMQYRLKVDNIYIQNDDWHYVGYDYNNIEIIPGSEHLMTLEWRWPFSTDDENDTLIGIAGGKLSVTLFLWAEVIDE